MTLDADRLSQTAELLHSLRRCAVKERGRGYLPAASAEALLWIAAGIDNLPDLGVAMGEPGRPLDVATVSRLVSALRGRDRWSGGRWVKAPFCLVATRKHPHKRGLHLSLTPQGENLLQIGR